VRQLLSSCILLEACVQLGLLQLVAVMQQALAPRPLGPGMCHMSLTSWNTTRQPAHPCPRPHWMDCRAPPRLRTLERPSNTEALKAAAEAQLHAELATRAKPTPVPPPPTAGVKLNTAAILREDALYRRKQEQEAAALQVPASCCSQLGGNAIEPAALLSLSAPCCHACLMQTR